VPYDLEKPHLIPLRELQHVDCVFHLAARVHRMGRRAHDEEAYQTSNAHATRLLAEAAARAGVRRFVFLSSVKVNGERSTTPFTVDSIPAPVDAYGRSKLLAELHLREIAARSSLQVAVVRSPLVYGPGVQANFKRLISLVGAGVPL